jgi:ABC-type phosphate transport system substrate-binding protein
MKLPHIYKLVFLTGIWMPGIWMLSAVSFNVQADETPPLAVVVSANPQFGSTPSLSIRELTQIFWRKKQYWQNGTRIHPVNLHAEHPLRILFSKAVLASLPSEQADYWNGLYFHGTTPPYSVQSEEAVLRYVSSTKGAIGYVSLCHLDERVKPLLWVDQRTISNSKPEFECSP